MHLPQKLLLLKAQYVKLPCGIKKAMRYVRTLTYVTRNNEFLKNEISVVIY